MIDSDDAKEIISENLKRLMHARGWSQADLVREMFEEVTQANRQMVSRWVGGKNPPMPADIVNLATALGCTTDDILGTPAR